MRKERGKREKSNMDRAGVELVRKQITDLCQEDIKDHLLYCTQEKRVLDTFCGHQIHGNIQVPQDICHITKLSFSLISFTLESFTFIRREKDEIQL